MFGANPFVAGMAIVHQNIEHLANIRFKISEVLKPTFLDQGGKQTQVFDFRRIKKCSPYLKI